eukprot:Lankesteria_metandrocarpae@DN754_c0_g1_i1.p1
MAGQGTAGKDSGRVWKSKRTKYSTTGATGTKTDWKQKAARRDMLKAVKKQDRDMKEGKREENSRRREQRKASKQRRAENELKSSAIQVIKQTSKLRKWDKKAKAKLIKMSPEMIEKYYGIKA